MAMGDTLGTIRGQMVLDVKQALAAYTQVRQQNISTVTALHTGAGALTSLGVGMTAAGAGMAAGILVAVDAAAQFERKLDYFGAVSDATQAEYDAIREKALELGEDTIYSADQIAESFIELGKSGVEARDIIDGIGEGVANLGAAADIPLDTAANIITSAVATFQLGADNAVMVADKLAGAANASIVDVEDLGVSLKYAGGVAASLGVPFEDLNVALAILGENGIKGSTAGTSLRQILLGLNGSTAKAKDALKELGIITADGSNQFYNMDGSAKSLSEVFQILQDATAGMSDQQKTAVMQQIFAVRALPSLIALTREGADGFNEMADAVNRTTAMEVASKRLDNLAGDIEILQGNIDTLLVKQGSGLQDFARGVVQGVTNIIQAFSNLPAGVQQGILIFASVVSIVLILVGVFGLIAGSILNMIALAIQLAPVWAFLGKALGIVTGAVRAFNLALMANPIGFIIGLIALIVGALIWFFTETELGREVWANFMQFLTEAWANISAVAVDIWNNVASFFSDLWTNISDFFMTAVQFISDIFFNWHPLGIIIANWDGIIQFFVDLWTNITTGIANFITGAISFFQNLPTRIGEFFAALPGMIGYALGFLLGTVVRFFLMIGTWLATNVPIMINNVITFFQQLPGRIVQFFTDLYNGAVHWVTQMAINIAIWAYKTYTGFINWIQQLPGMIVKFFTDLYNGAVKWITNTALTVISKAMAIYNGIVNWIRQLPAMVSQFFNDVVRNVTRFMTDALNNAKRIASDIFNGIKNGIEGIPRLVTGIFNNVVQAIKDVIGRAVRAVRDFASGLWEGFKDGLGINSPSYIEHAMWAITGVIDDETQHMKKQVRVVQNLGNGITEMGQNMGFGFGAQLDQDLIALQKQVAAAKSLSAEVAGGQFGIANDASTQVAAINGLNQTLQAIAEKDTINVEKLEVVNPEPEPTSESLPSAIRKLAYIG